MASDDLVFVGVVHPPQDPTPPSYAVGPNDFCDDNLRAMDLDGLPLHYNHDTSARPLGTVLRTVTGHEGLTKIIVGRVDAEHADAIANIESGRWPELSLQHDFTARLEGNVEKQTRTPLEVSFTEKGNRPGCRIIHSHRHRRSHRPQISGHDTPRASPTMQQPQAVVAQQQAQPQAAAAVPIAQQPQIAAVPQQQQPAGGELTQQQQQQPAQAPTDAPAAELAEFATVEGVAAKGWTQDQLVEGFATSTAAMIEMQAKLRQLEEQNAELAKRNSDMASSTQRELENKVSEIIDLLRQDSEVSAEDEKAMRDLYGTAQNVEEAEMKHRVLNMQLANKHLNNERIRKQENDLAVWRAQNKNEGIQRYHSLMQNMTASAAVDNGPLAPSHKRFASQALEEAVAAPTRSVPVQHQQQTFAAADLGSPAGAPAAAAAPMDPAAMIMANFHGRAIPRPELAQ